ncbi:diuretic hormone receptor isoform X1 [Lucilia sericata]|uniref:diuretic hormone receptor isoform X1 n=1 Tax=Lucilia sericata TaxID=13632 RepID=UPI0018A8454F|nr:diuretic hormone receptor isoform X1 [Lucilia sericata]XP_037815372.1 diuretic hormone receptor isoform X1 [Lucilia sericata]XP_037815373.1 diuretic hormone receptor isoform X1 [Lucilia sericata]XP_037815374.1 diuretic hormone receptor isoform X1 [Lucilia sericata]XP_037815375.1 diuretic hormone receptor isoform X1 [Lucilia sericata]
MDAPDLRALVDSFTDGRVTDLSDAFANFSTEMLQQANALLAATATSTNGLLDTDTNTDAIIHLEDIEVAAALALSNTDTLVNRTLEMQCLRQQQQDERTAANSLTSPANFISCPVSFDSVLCWPRTPAGTWAILPCFEEFKGVHYDSTQNATRFCFPNGTWNNYSNYDKCHHAVEMPAVPDFAPGIELPAYIYCCGYFISFAALVLALIVFLCFKDLKCLRNTIHANLFLTYILSALLWILTLFLQVMTDHASPAGCITLVMMFHYFNLTNFFWMFVEGLYLYTLVVQTFSSDNLGFLQYALIGWGCPAIIIFAWSIAKVYAPPLDSGSFNGLDIECSWMRESHIDWIFQGPASLVLTLNLIFLIRIMWVLITKLRSANTLETRQYHKASKALMVLIPLFGITYLLVLVGPEQGISRNLFEITRAFLISTQGFFVSLFFCFLNSEVRQTLRHRFVRWRDNRNLRRGSSNRNRRHRLSKDYSQRSRTESLRLTSTTSPITTVHFE